MKKLLFVDERNSENFWKDELPVVSREYEVTALSYKSVIRPVFGCIKYCSHTACVDKIGYLLNCLKFFFDPICQKEIKDIWLNHSSKFFICLIKSIRYYADMMGFGVYIDMCLKNEVTNSVIYTYWCNECTLYFAINKERYVIDKLVTRMHGFDLYEERRTEGRQPFRWLINEKVDKIVVCGQQNQEYYLKTHPRIDKDKVVVGRLGCTSIGRTPIKRSNEFMLVSCSLIKELKRVDLIVSALAEIDDIKIKWIHFGENQIGESFISFCKDKLDEKENLTYELMGNVANGEIRQFYIDNHVDAFITTSSTEGAPVSIMEAMSAGIPIIATSVGDIPNMIKENGMLLEANPRVQDVVAAIGMIANLNADDYEKCQKKSYSIWDNNYNSFENALEMLEVLRTV